MEADMLLASLAEPVRGSIGLIIPSANRLTEPQLNLLAPPGFRFYVTRLRFVGEHERSLGEILSDAAEAAELLVDAGAELIVFHCTGRSMSEGLAGERAMIEAIHAATGRPTITTASGVLAALQALNMRRIVLASPYVSRTNQLEVAYLREAGVEVLAERGMNLPQQTDQYVAVTPAMWVDYVTAMADPAADGYFVSCTTIRAIEAIEELENALGRPVVTSNQAVLWYCLRHFGYTAPIPHLGQLMQRGMPVANAVAAI
jgi:maleate isomerase